MICELCPRPSPVSAFASGVCKGMRAVAVWGWAAWHGAGKESRAASPCALQCWRQRLGMVSSKGEHAERRRLLCCVCEHVCMRLTLQEEKKLWVAHTVTSWRPGSMCVEVNGNLPLLTVGAGQEVRWAVLKSEFQNTLEHGLENVD